MKRLQLETGGTIVEELCNYIGVPVDYMIYAGMVQFKDTYLRLGQISRFLIDPNPIDKLEESEAALQISVRKVLPILLQLTGTLHHCLVSLTNDAIPLMSSRPKNEGVQVFCGFNIP